MISKRLCTICVRGGSQGLPKKNIKLLQGKPLIYHTIKVAKESKLFDEIVVSSDSDEILNIAKECGATLVVKRPKELATNESGKIPAIIHAISEVEKINKVKYNTFVDLDATSPLRLVDDITLCVNKLEESDLYNVITASPSHRSPYFNLIEISKDGYVNLSKPNFNIVRRQDSPRCFDMNASIYVWKREYFLDNPKIFYDKTGLIVMPDTRSRDIDSDLDFKIIEMILSQKLHLNGKSYAQ